MKYCYPIIKQIIPLTRKKGVVYAYFDKKTGQENIWIEEIIAFGLIEDMMENDELFTYVAPLVDDLGDGSYDIANPRQRIGVVEVEDNGLFPSEGEIRLRFDEELKAEREKQRKEDTK